ncbi:NAD-dependent DNA ligase [Kitasatospora gansuensis]|uniref:NAD-dependent DNA ligase n=1 Tax=Kitasatospora gansuensis TaxID=258050 RepID=A0A7W7S7V0_9ACTN|nr:NAD-dependent DNA ligase [Kitasatospora gansuensis]
MISIIEAPCRARGRGLQPVRPTCPFIRDIDTSEQRWRCVQGRGCQAVASIRYAASRDQLDIAGLGGTRAVQLVESGLVADLADLFTLTRDQLLTLERMGETSADNLLAALETARHQPLHRVFCALGVQGTFSELRLLGRYMHQLLRLDGPAVDAFGGPLLPRARVVLQRIPAPFEHDGASFRPIVGGLWCDLA